MLLYLVICSLVPFDNVIYFLSVLSNLTFLLDFLMPCVIQAASVVFLVTFVLWEMLDQIMYLFCS
jgi:hypothetical protein